MEDNKNGILYPMHRKCKNRNEPSGNNLQQQVDPSIVPIVAELDKLFDKLNEKYFKRALLKPVITLSQKGTKLSEGCCAEEKIWADVNENRYFEININPSYLNHSVEVICEILLHQMVHLLNRMNGVVDCTSGGQYHNKNFQISAEQHGLVVRKDSRYGYAKTSLKQETLEFIDSLNLTAFSLYRDVGKAKCIDKKMKRPSSTRKYICPKCKTSIRATKEVRVRCDACNVLFQKC